MESSGNFKQLFDHSALIFKSELAARIGYKTVNLRLDNQISSPKAKYGVISFKNFENLKKKLSDNGIVEDKTLSDEHIIYLKLPKTYSKQEIQNFIDNLANQRMKFQQTITPNNLNPMLFVRLENLEKMLYENLRQTHPFAQKTIGIKVFDLIVESLNLYLFYANSKTQHRQQYLERIKVNLEKIRYNMKTIENLSLVHAKNIERILEEIIIIERIIKKK